MGWTQIERGKISQNIQENGENLKSWKLAKRGLFERTLLRRAAIFGSGKKKKGRDDEEEEKGAVGGKSSPAPNSGYDHWGNWNDR